jgi:hypothetical protein
MMARVWDGYGMGMGRVWDGYGICMGALIGVEECHVQMIKFEKSRVFTQGLYLQGDEADREM